jgi:hypothetical protein
MDILEQAMNSIKYPSLRANIDAAIEALADPELQRRAWIGRQAAPVGECPSFDDAVHWLFDDSGINNGAKSSVGELFYDDREAQSVDSVMFQIDRLLDKYGGELADEQYINTSEWPEIVATAAQCLRLLRENDRKHQGTLSS